MKEMKEFWLRVGNPDIIDFMKEELYSDVIGKEMNEINWTKIRRDVEKNQRLHELRQLHESTNGLEKYLIDED